MKEFMLSALHDGAFKLGQFKCILNASKFSFANFTRQEGEHSSIIDYLLTSLPSLPRVQKFHVETRDQVRGANGCGSDYNILWLDYSLDFDIPSWHAPPPKLMFDRIAFQKTEIKKDYQEDLTPLLNEWNAKVKDTLESPLFKTLPLPVRSTIFDCFYHQWTFLFYQAKCKTVPIRSISPFSRIYVDEEHEALTARRVEAHTKLKQYLDLRSTTSAQGQGSNDLASDPIWLNLWGMYAQLRSDVASLAASLKAERWIKLLEKIDDDAQSDQRHFFSSIAKVRGTKVDSSIDTLYTMPMSETNPTPVSTSDPEQIKEVLRSSFQNQAKAHDPGDPKFDSAFFTTVCQEVGAVPPEAVGSQVLEEPLTFKEVEAAIDQAQNNKAPGQDTMFNESIKYGGENAAQSCFFLFTQLFENGISPSSWSKALIHLIFKGGNKDLVSCSSYRPISLISIVSKIYERVLLNRAGDTYCYDCAWLSLTALSTVTCNLWL
jgi:hypothetical protein